MRILVTGAGGFAGGHMARRLAEAGHHVFALTRSSPVEAPASAAATERFEVVTAALDQKETLPPEIDAIVHTAATSIWHGISVDSMIADNVIATRALINHALDVKARAFIFFSSISAFGRVAVGALDESVPTTDPDAYGATKILGEQHLADVAARLPSLSIRLPAVIGRGSKRNWPSEVLRKLRAVEDLSFFNPQTPFNNVVHEADLAALVASALGKELAGHDMVVVGSGGQTTSGAVVDLLVAETGSASRITTREEARHSFLIDCDRARQRYGFEPMPVEEAVRRFARET
ncbi:MAG: NAD(P)-dependent oxidoreductase [Pseudomonadota bacterium]